VRLPGGGRFCPLEVTRPAEGMAGEPVLRHGIVSAIARQASRHASQAAAHAS
jgi:hypothetical protein